MAGGSANRFWPISRESRPKQFLDIASSGRSLIRMTYDRFSKLVPKENILVVTLDKFGELVQEQIPELPTNNLLLEPYSRNTAPCIAYSTLEIIKRNPDATIVVTPADHIITDEESFGKAVEEILGLPDTVRAFAIFPYGYPAEERKQHQDQEQDLFVSV